MDRSIEVLERIPVTRPRTVLLALCGASLVLAAVSLYICTFPSQGYLAGRDAVTAKGQEWVEEQVEAAGGIALRACDEVLEQTREGFHADYYAEFIKGCSAGVDALTGRHVPVLTGE